VHNENMNACPDRKGLVNSENTQEHYQIKFINHDVAQIRGNVMFTLSAASG
jgi:hypothetical protein